jgi:hypothetical protein
MGPADLISRLFKTSRSFNRRSFRPPALHWGLQSGAPKMALYSLTGLAKSLFHDGPAQVNQLTGKQTGTQTELENGKTSVNAAN